MLNGYHDLVLIQLHFRRIAYYDEDYSKSSNEYDNVEIHKKKLIHQGVTFIPAYPHEPVTDIDVPSKCAYPRYKANMWDVSCGRTALAYEGRIVANVTQENR